MSLPDDLLEQADHLLGRDATRPKQASLRRALSVAYYALFHLLIREACARLNVDRDLRTLAARAFGHGEMKKACQAVLRSSPPALLVPFLGTPVPADLREVASAFVDLHAARQDADYNLSRDFRRAEARQLVRLAHGAFAAWDRVKSLPAADAFLLSLLLGERWNR